jgi:hypothetical protein
MIEAMRNMFAKVIHQDKEIKKIFYERIKEKVEKEKQNSAKMYLRIYETR